jgi:hypothetical protein
MRAKEQCPSAEPETSPAQSGAANRPAGHAMMTFEASDHTDIHGNDQARRVHLGGLP